MTTEAVQPPEHEHEDIPEPGTLGVTPTSADAPEESPAPPTGRTVHVSAWPMWVLGLVIFIDQVADERPPALLEQAVGDIDMLVVLAVEPEVESVGGAPRRLAQPVHGYRDQHTRRTDDEKGRPPPECGAHEPPDADAYADAGQQQALLHGERLPPLLLGVIVADEAGGRRLRDGLAEAEGRADGEQRAIRRHRCRQSRQARPGDDGVADRAAAVPAISEITGGAC